MRLLIAAALLAASALAPTQATELPEGWQTWTWSGNCFAVAHPGGAAIPEVQAAKPYASVRHSPSEDSFDAVAISSGLPSGESYEGAAEIDGKTFDLLVYDGAGFVSSSREPALIEAMIKGAEMVVTWTQATGMVVHTYTLAGFTTAKRTIDGACPRPRAR